MDGYSTLYPVLFSAIAYYLLSTLPAGEFHVHDMDRQQDGQLCIGECQPGAGVRSQQAIREDNVCQLHQERYDL